MYSIIGSGFGLYGYLPAIIKLHKKDVVLPIKYKESILSRSELIEFEKSIIWVKDRDEALKKTTDLVIAVPPDAQEELIINIIHNYKINTLFLEKPIAKTPEKAAKILELIKNSRIKCIVGYSFLYIPIKEKFSLINQPSTEIYWEWEFMAHHFLNNLKNWKRYHSHGGGVLRFYGIHVIAFLYIYGFRRVLQSFTVCDTSDEPYIWEAKFADKNNSVCNVKVNCKSECDLFKIYGNNNESTIVSKDPFKLLEKLDNKVDRRVQTLSCILLSDTTGSDLMGDYIGINSLWDAVESMNIIKTNQIQ
jgi:predicted dehydrogenase